MDSQPLSRQILEYIVPSGTVDHTRRFGFVVLVTRVSEACSIGTGVRSAMTVALVASLADQSPDSI